MSHRSETQTGQKGWNALQLVCRYYKKENLINIVKLLLDKNIETNCKTNSGCDVLHTVCRYCHNRNLIEIVQLLINTEIFGSLRMERPVECMSILPKRQLDRVG
jgi:hypothetical protein